LIQRQSPTGGLAGAVLAAALAARTHWIVVMDADLSHPPERIPDLVAPLLDGSHDMVLGSRYVPGGRTPGWPWWRRSMSRVACQMAWPLAHCRDPLSGFFATDRGSLIQCQQEATGFKIALELIVAAGPTFRVKEIPIAFHDRERGKSKIRFAILAIYLFRLIILIFRRLDGRTSHSQAMSQAQIRSLSTVDRPAETIER
jgi:dolichol-phosphate mannosyltransferase